MKVDAGANGDVMARLSLEKLRSGRWRLEEACHQRPRSMSKAFKAPDKAIWTDDQDEITSMYFASELA